MLANATGAASTVLDSRDKEMKRLGPLHPESLRPVLTDFIIERSQEELVASIASTQICEIHPNLPKGVS